jgi:hypothetical protein
MRLASPRQPRQNTRRMPDRYGHRAFYVAGFAMLAACGGRATPEATPVADAGSIDAPTTPRREGAACAEGIRCEVGFRCDFDDPRLATSSCGRCHEVSLGAACRVPKEKGVLPIACPEGSACVPEAPDGSGTCRPKQVANAGQSCDFSARVCATGLTCAQQRCWAPQSAGEGGDCVLTTTCQQHLFCDVDGRCRAKLAVGERCAGREDACSNGWCFNEACVASAREGESCSTTRCTSESICLDDRCVAAGLGRACVGRAMLCGQGLECTPDGVCDLPHPVPLGARCNAFFPCAVGACREQRCVDLCAGR